MTFGETIRSLRKRKGIAQLYAAAGAGVSQGYLSRIEAGKATPSTAIVVRLAQVVGVDPQRYALNNVKEFTAGRQWRGKEEKHHEARPRQTRK